MGLSSFASKPIEEVVAANPAVFFQLYWIGGRDAMLARLERARSAGAQGLIIPLEWSFSYGRDWGSPRIPEKINLKEMVKLAPETIVKPKWLWEFGRRGHIPDLTVPNMVNPGETPPPFFGAYFDWMNTPTPTWDDLAWLIAQWDGPVMLKGISRIDDAKRAVDVGAHTISVSNHGGNNVDGTPATIRLLPGIVDAVGSEIEVVLDGGIRRGSDVVKAVALGARAVMIGRAYLWGLAANGQAGVENVLDIMRNGMTSTMFGLHRESIHDLSRRDVVIPPHFAVTLGHDTNTV